jgi:hypothetical protein
MAVTNETTLSERAASYRSLIKLVAAEKSARWRIDDLSGMASDFNGSFLMVDDAGRQSNGLKSIRFYPHDSEGKWFDLTLPMAHFDLEGTSYRNGRWYITTSLSDPNNAENQITSSFVIQKIGNTYKIADFQTKKKMGQAIKNALSQTTNLIPPFNNMKDQQAWIQRILVADAKSGGLNIEGFSASGTNPDELIYGLRSPLAGSQFADPKINDNLALGDSLFAIVSKPFSKTPKISVKSLPLKGKGIRSMEWFPALNGYIVTTGPVSKGEGYGLWFIDSNLSKAKTIQNVGFEKLYRPESVFQMTKVGEDYLVIRSESVDSPSDVGYSTVLKIRIKDVLSQVQ